MLFITPIILALSAIATANVPIESAIFNRIMQLDIGMQGTYILLDKVGEDDSNVTASDIVVLYNACVAPSTNTMEPMPTACDEALQFSLCQAYHSFVLTSTKLYDDLASEADSFNKETRNNLREGLERIYLENKLFSEKISPNGLPCCDESVQCDCIAFNKAFMEAWWALDPSTGSS